MMRLNKYLAHAGVGSRRRCDELILSGHVSIDGQKTREPGTQVDPEAQTVGVDGKPVRAEPPTYWLLNKPRGVLSTNYDPAGRERVIDLVAHVRQRVYTVGRLDEDSEGLILLTNDGDLANRLMHPRFGVEKTYVAQVAGKPTRADLERLLKGVWLSDGHVQARRVKLFKKQGESSWLEIVLAEGKNREVRRMLARLGHKVMRLRRIAIAGLRLGRLRPGKSRRLRPEEVDSLRRAAGRTRKTEDSRQETGDRRQGTGDKGRKPRAGRRERART